MFTVRLINKLISYSRIQYDMLLNDSSGVCIRRETISFLIDEFEEQYNSFIINFYSNYEINEIIIDS